MTSAERVERAIEHLRAGLASGDAEEYRHAMNLARSLRADALLTPEERARRERRRTAARTRAVLAGPAAAYRRSQKQKAS